MNWYMVHTWHSDVVCDFIFIFDAGNVVILNYVNHFLYVVLCKLNKGRIIQNEEKVP